MNAKIVVIDEMPFRTSMVYQNLSADIYLEGFVGSTLTRLAARASEMADANIGERRRSVAQRHDKMVSGLRAAEKAAATKTPLDPVTLCATLSEIMPKDTVFVDETTTHSSLIQNHIVWNEYGRYFYVQGGLGQGLGVALGVKLAKRSQPVVLCIGDGSFLYNPVIQSLGAARDIDLPLLIVVFNNSRYEAMFQNLRRFYPDGVAVSEDNLRGVRIKAPSFTSIAEAFGGIGLEATDRASLAKALNEGLKAVRTGRTVIVNAILSR